MKKILGLVVCLLAVVTLTACGSGDGSMLYGDWFWTFDGARLTFNEDGTGEWPNMIGLQTFDWEIRRGDIRMTNSRNERATWSFEIEGDRLYIERSDGADTWNSFIYERGADASVNDVEIEDIEVEDIEISAESDVSAELLVGSWSWEFDGSFQLVFEEDGSGEWVGIFDSIEWEFVNDELRIDDGTMIQRWSVSLAGDALTITSLQEDDMVYTYLRD